MNRNKTKPPGKCVFTFIPWVAGILLTAICMLWIVAGIWAAWVTRVTLY